MVFDAVFLVWLLIAAITIGLLVCCFVYQMRARRRHEEACFDAMLCMLLQPTTANIAALDRLLVKGRIGQKQRFYLLYQAEVEADCLSVMPTGEMRAKQPFLQRRYNQILATAKGNGAVSELVKIRLASF